MTWFKCGGGGGGIPAILKSLMNSVFNKKFGTAEIYPPEIWPDTVNLMGPLEEKTVSGSVVAFNDGSDDVPLKKCEITVPANLTGVSSVAVLHTGKNLVSNSASAWESGTINSSGNNASGNGTRTIDYFDIKGGLNYKISGVIAPETGSDFRIFFYDKNKDFITYKNYNSTPTIPENACFFRVRNISIADISALQIEYGDTATAYKPYIEPATYTAALGRTIYGGTADIVNGPGSDDWCEPLTFTGADSENWLWGQNGGYYRANITIQNIAYTVGARSECFCNLGTYKASGNDYNACFIYGNPTSAQFFYYPPQGVDTLEAFKTWLSSNNLKMTAPKAAPEAFTFTPVPVNSLLDNNTLWSDDGDLEVVYRSTGTETIIQPTLVTKEITENGTYNAASDNADGYSSVTVNVPTGATNIETVLGENPLIELNGVTGTDVSRVMWTRTAATAEKVIFHPNTKVKTNTGSNEGYFKVLKNSEVIASTYSNTSSTTAFSIPDVVLSPGDVIEVRGGFDNYHTNAWFELYSTITVVS